MKYLVFLLIFVVSFSVLGMKTNSIERWDPGEFSYEDSVFYTGQTKIIQIEYNMDNGSIMPSSEKVLDSLSTFLEKNPNLSVEISVHTDSRGNDKYNLELSKRRANALENYLISKKGIDVNRLTKLGAGETQKIYSDEYISQNGLTPEAKELLHQRNRRTVLTITSVNYQKK